MAMNNLEKAIYDQILTERMEWIQNCENRNYEDYWYSSWLDMYENYDEFDDTENTAFEQWIEYWLRLALSIVTEHKWQ